MNKWRLFSSGVLYEPIPKMGNHPNQIRMADRLIINHGTLKTLLVLLFTLLSAAHCTSTNNAETDGSILSDFRLTPARKPIFMGKPEMPAYELRIQCKESADKIILKKVVINFTQTSQPDCIASLSVASTGEIQSIFGTAQQVSMNTILSGSLPLQTGLNFIELLIRLKENASLTGSFEIKDLELTFGDQQSVKVAPDAKFIFRPAILVRAAGQDQVNTYRIPGLVTTNKGTLIAVYDIRYLGSGDLQGDIDVGISRSTDGGQTWEPMKKVIDMGTYNDLPQNQNGVGDPSILVDEITNTIWVAGLWVSGLPGQTAWNGSKPGLKPGETGQFILVKSEDDGLTWSQPINITEQCKNQAWNLFFQGPGKGITMKNGILVFPAQFKDDQKVPFSTIIYSKDHGKIWVVGTGAKSNTTESQVVQLADGSLMLNMRDDRNRTEKGDQNGRAVTITKDLGQTWTVHSSSNAALPESNCMASIISAKVMINGISKDVLFFSNPNDKNERAHMTIKASMDQGVTWPVQYQVELNSNDSYGYSCLTMVNESTLGILYEGTKELNFQEIKVSEILKP